MPTCKKCLLPFQLSITINDKERISTNRIHCFECVPFNSQRDNKVNLNHDQSQEKSCQCCGKIYRIWKGSNNGSTYCNSCKTSKRRIYLKIKAIDYLGGQCKRCGYHECIEALVFHHRIPSEKSFGIGSNYNKAWYKIQDELDKCDLLCSNCHSFIHYSGMITKSLPLYEGIKAKLVREHKEKTNAVKDKIKYSFCLYCNKEFVYDDKNRKYCSLECSKISHRKVERPSKDVLTKEVKMYSMVALGKKYGVSDNAVRKWCNSYGITWRKK